MSHAEAQTQLKAADLPRNCFKLQLNVSPPPTRID
jgi:hypothetical protein